MILVIISKLSTIVQANSYDYCTMTQECHYDNATVVCDTKYYTMKPE